MAHHSHIRSYNPRLTTPSNGAKFLKATKKPSRCLRAPLTLRLATQTYREWRQLGAAIGAALMRAGEAAKEQSEAEKREGDEAR